MHSQASRAIVSRTSQQSTKPDPEQLFRLLWTQEEIPGESTLSDEDCLAIEHFSNTHKRLPSGAYAVALPRRLPTPLLGESRSVAVKRFRQNERSLQRRDQWQAFADVLNEYSVLDHAEQVPPEDMAKSASEVFYMPAHGVFKATSTTTRLRCVFDASAKSSTGVSLNDQLLAGPTLHPRLTTILSRFRLHAVAISSDISKMFCGIHLLPEEKDLHRFLVRSYEGDLQDWRMRRLTFGVTSSPFLATSVLRQAASDLSETYPLASAALLSDFYVDDCLSGASDISGALHLQQELCQLLNDIGFVLRKWRSNSSELLKHIPEELRETSPKTISPELTDFAKALGVHWDTESDSFFISIPIIDDAHPTKCSIASAAARLFDVMGWMSPVMLYVKILLQTLWQCHLDWDENIPRELMPVWEAWASELSSLSKFPISRRYTDSSSPVVEQQLHAFSDASSKGFGGVVYLRQLHKDTTISISLVMAKTRVAPVNNSLTIPKLELSAALLTARLLKVVGDDLHIPPDKWYCWCDSTITLGWIQHSSIKWKVFVSNRVSQIVSITSSKHWRYVPTASNPADHASRGLTPAALTTCCLWWEGPPWLYFSPSQWPAPPTAMQPNSLPEASARVLTISSKPPADHLWSRFSSFSKAIRVLSWCRRFGHNAKLKPGRRVSLERLSAKEIDATLTRLI